MARPRSRRLLRTAPAVAVLAAVACGSGTAGPEPVDEIVLVVADTLRADRLGLYGHPRGSAPALERWADRAVVFERALATSPWTLPSFASLLTGQPPARHGAGAFVRRERAQELARTHPVTGMRIHGEERWYLGLDPALPTLAERLRDAGFATAAFVNNPFLDERFGLARGFGRWDHEPGGDLRSRRADEMVERFLAWREATRDRRRFALVHFFDPHMSYDAPPPYAGRYTREAPDAPRSERFAGAVTGTQAIRDALPELSDADRAHVAAAYDEEVAFVADQLGRLLDALEADGALGRTLVAFTADHGEELFDRGGFGHGHSVHQELLHVPLVFWGAALRPGRADAPVSIADLPATLLDAAGLPPLAGGASLWPRLHGTAPGPDAPTDRTLAAGNPGSDDEEAVALGWPYKLVRSRRTGEERLYHLERDPGETRDLAAEQPAEHRRLAAWLDEALAGSARGRPVPLDPELAERLRGLGYLE